MPSVEVKVFQLVVRVARMLARAVHVVALVEVAAEYVFHVVALVATVGVRTDQVVA